MSETKVSVSRNGPVVQVTFSTDGGLNIFSSAVLNKLDAAVGEVARQCAQPGGMSDAVRVCVFTGEGKVFFAGADIKEMSGCDVEGARRFGQHGSDVFDAVAALPCVTIAALNGAALGGGLELALACDFRYAVRTAKVGLTETTLGLIPGWGGVRRLPELVGPAQAKRMIFSGEAIKAEDAVAMGLIDEAVNSTEDLAHRVEAVAKSFFNAGPHAIAAAKRAMRDGDDLTAFADCFLEDTDGHPGMKAFIEKRKPRWAPG